MHYNFSTTFEKKYLDGEAVAPNQERLRVEAAATKLETEQLIEESKATDDLDRLNKWFAKREQLIKDAALKNKATIAKMKQLEDQATKKAVKGTHNKEVATIKKRERRKKPLRSKR